jgi:LysM repeat protein
MGSGAKIALVALLILMVVAVAKFVQNGSDEAAQNAAGKKEVAAGPRLAQPGVVGVPNPAKPPKISSRNSTGLPPKETGQPPAKSTLLPETKSPGHEGTIAQAPPPAPVQPGSSAGSLPGPIGSQSPNQSTVLPPRPPEAEKPAPVKNEPPVVAKAGPPPGPAGGTTNRDLPASPSGGGTGIRPGSQEVSGHSMLVEQVPPPLSKTPDAKPSLLSTSFPQDYKVETGDSYWKIAEKFYGTGKGKLYKSITVANGNASLVAGKTIKVPAPPTESKSSSVATESAGTKARSPSPAPSNPDGEFEYVVQRGDSVIGIAKKFSRKQKEIEKANPGLQYQTLKAGAKLTIPKKTV